jgi:hypothetical protein
VLIGSIFKRAKEAGSPVLHLDMMFKTLRAHELLYAWLLGEMTPKFGSGQPRQTALAGELSFLPGTAVRSVFILENDVHFTNITAIRTVFDRFCQSGVDFLSQDVLHATPHGSTRGITVFAAAA